MKKLFYILTFLIIGNAYAQSNIKVNEKAPIINITDWIENVPSDKNLNDKYLVLEFWATWCGPFIAAVPHMNSVQKEFNQKDLYYISITDESVAKVERSLKRINFNSIVVTDLTKKTQINFGDGVKGLDAYPLTVLIDKTGIIKWIGDPKNLNSEIMSTFLTNSNTENANYSLEKNIIPKEQNPILNFKDLLKNNEVKYYFNLIEAEGTEPSKQAMGTSIIILKSYSLKDIYNSVFNIKSTQIKLPENIENIKFDLTYKNFKEPENLNLLETDILKKLHLEKQTELRPTNVNIVSIQNQSLLEKTLENQFSSISHADDKIIFTRNTITQMLNELSNVSTEQFKYNDKNETKYDFIIGIESKNDIVTSLNSYGLTIADKEAKIEYITLISGK